ncbi:hypothetical protein KSF_037610 [Reticulibacter mediterranei]|uniref:Uncharacterized protein n=1 Tax=Reticulibacter mediterranei TaxID=2778369 RepID=A0A8J3N2U4_9CHLR|nr:hypothetical protein [Reticulibacter mediterranei]GHO93713.1 hypothetical protein KSF_037610 [Reticulibacter mediterranei]
MSDQIPPDERPSLDESAPPIAEPNKKRQYWLGVAYGAIPLVIFLIGGVVARLSRSNYGVNGIFPTAIGVIVYIILLVITIIYLTKREKRFIGYGLLTLLLITPVVAVYGCMLIIQAN